MKYGFQEKNKMKFVEILQEIEGKPYIETVIERGLDGVVTSARRRCTVCGEDWFWARECLQVMHHGKHRSPDNPREETPRRRKKYRKTPKDQMTLFGNNLHDLFWGKTK